MLKRRSKPANCTVLNNLNYSTKLYKGKQLKWNSKDTSKCQTDTKKTYINGEFKTLREIKKHKIHKSEYETTVKDRKSDKAEKKENTRNITAHMVGKVAWTKAE